MSLPRSVLNTNRFPVNERLPLWRDSATSVWDVSSVTSDTFYAHVDAFHAADLMFGTVKSSGQNTERVGARIAADNLDYYMFQFYVSGQRQAVVRGKEYIAANGDLLVVDMTQPIKTASTTYQSYDLVMPRRLLEPLLAYPDDHAGQCLATALPLTGLLRSHLLALYRAGLKMSEAEAVAMQGPTLALAAATLNGSVSEEMAAPVRIATLLAVRRYIEDNLSDMTMSLEQVACTFGISRATLYRIMEPMHGFVNYVRRRRLYRCRVELADPACRYRLIGDIAASWGFRNLSAFSTLFTRSFGISPRDYRELIFNAGGNTAVPPQESEVDWSRWLAAMY